MHKWVAPLGVLILVVIASQYALLHWHATDPTTPDEFRLEFTTRTPSADFHRADPALWSRTDVNLASLCNSPPQHWQDRCVAEMPPAAASAAASLGAYRIIQYNVFRAKTRGTHELIGDWLQARGADYVSLNELNDFNASSFHALAVSRGFAYSAFLETRTGYHVGFLSKRDRIVDTETFLEGYHHGVLHTTLESGKHFFVTHLSPGAPAKRAGEAERLRAVIERLLTQTTPAPPVFLLGDMNSVPPEDGAVLEAAANAWGQEVEPGSAAEFAHRAMRRKFFKDGGKVGHGAMRALRRVLVDLCAEAASAVGNADAAAAAAWPGLNGVGGGCANTVPTALGEGITPKHERVNHSGNDSNATSTLHFTTHGLPMRLDYVFASAGMQEPGSKSSAFMTVRAVRHALTSTLSDHYPLEVLVEPRSRDKWDDDLTKISKNSNDRWDDDLQRRSNATSGNDRWDDDLQRRSNNSNDRWDDDLQRSSNNSNDRWDDDLQRREINRNVRRDDSLQRRSLSINNKRSSELDEKSPTGVETTTSLQYIQEQPGPEGVGCAEAALPCKWLAARQKLTQQLHDASQSARAKNKDQWTREQATVPPPESEFETASESQWPFPWHMVTATRSGQSCNEVCHHAFSQASDVKDDVNRPDHRTAGQSTAGSTSILRTALCVEAARPFLSTCARLTADGGGGCPLGCAWIHGPELPARVTDLDSGTAGQCLLEKGEPSVMQHALPQSLDQDRPQGHVGVPFNLGLRRAARLRMERREKRRAARDSGQAVKQLRGDVAATIHVGKADSSTDEGSAEIVAASARRRVLKYHNKLEDSGVDLQPTDNLYNEYVNHTDNWSLYERIRDMQDGKIITVGKGDWSDSGISRYSGAHKTYPGGRKLEAKGARRDKYEIDDDDVKDDDDGIFKPKVGAANPLRTIQPPLPGPWCAASHAHTSRLCACAPVAFVVALESPPAHPTLSPTLPLKPQPSDPNVVGAAVESADGMIADDKWELPSGVSMVDLALQAYRAEVNEKAAAKAKVQAQVAVAAAAEASRNCSNECMAQGLGLTGYWSTLLGEQCSGQNQKTGTEPLKSRKRRDRLRLRTDEIPQEDSNGQALLPYCLALTFKPPRLHGSCVCPSAESDPKLGLA